ncbi:DUF397 domain-containing protein [Nonomuraea sp. NPDC050547]|uniref:DUF397 domain-containing protein n=1 Tax=Nonomuraea sp. NPDC050547 TaxID=3364368 RepID=UPI0037ADA765
MRADGRDPYSFDLSHVEWRKSSRSTGDGECVQIAVLADGSVAVRDSKRTTRRPLCFTAVEWAAFIYAIRVGEFDQVSDTFSPE